MKKLDAIDLIKYKFSVFLYLSAIKILPPLIKIFFYIVILWIFYLNYKFYDYALKTNLALENIAYIICSNVFSVVFILISRKFIEMELKKIGEYKERWQRANTLEETGSQDLEE